MLYKNPALQWSGGCYLPTFWGSIPTIKVINLFARPKFEKALTVLKLTALRFRLTGEKKV